MSNLLHQWDWTLKLRATQTGGTSEEASDAFASDREPEGWNDRNEAVVPLFLNNDLRIADAHETVEQCLTTLQLLGFDTANINAGYGRALDFVMDGVITALGIVATAIEKLLKPT